MSTHNLRVFGLQDATCNDRYDGAWTETQAVSEARVSATPSDPGAASPRMVTVRVGDVVAALSQGMGNKLAWIDDFRDDPIAVSQDLYEVLLAYRRLRRAA